jgi:hypothetical protein
MGLKHLSLKERGGRVKRSNPSVMLAVTASHGDHCVLSRVFHN